MAHELILTSVSQGLEPESNGFCVVAADQNIPPFLVKRLTTLSEFRHLFPPDSEESKLQPVAYSHVIVSGAETTWHVLSRVANTGTDFRHEPNRLAHHIALEESDMVKEGPAWLLALHGFHLTDWFTPSVRFERCRPIPTLTTPPPLTRRQRIAREHSWLDPKKMALTLPVTEDPIAFREWAKQNEEQVFIAGPPTSPCLHWQELTGDAGWGGVLADTIRTGQQVVLLYHPGLNLLPLFVESLSILPHSVMWKGTFGTYHTWLPEHTVCQWKGIVADSPDLEKWIDSDTLVLDLTQSLGQPPEGPYVEYARSGSANLLPADDSVESFFSKADAETKSYDTGTGPPVPAGSDLFPTPPIPNRTEMTASSSNLDMIQQAIPPVLPEEHFVIRTRNKKKKGGLLAFLLNMKSRNGFYILYGMTLALVLLLLTLVLDQFFDFGVTRWIRGEHRSSNATLGPKGSPNSPSRPDVGDSEPASKLSEEEIQKGQERLREEEQAKAEEQRLRQKQKEEQTRALIDESKRKKEADTTRLKQTLPEIKLPQNLALAVPTIEDDKIIPPQSPQLFASLSVLYPFGQALELKLLPLLELPHLRVETRKHRFYHQEPNREQPKHAMDSKLETLPPSEFAPIPGRWDPDFEEEPSDLRIPDGTRFEWYVVAVDTRTDNETHLFQLKLTGEGLHFGWTHSGMMPQHFFNTLWTSIGFLRVCAEGEQDPAKVRSIPLFKPKIVPSIMPFRDFSDQGSIEKSIEMPFAKEPWSTLFRSGTVPPLVFRLETKIIPETPQGIKRIGIQEGLLESEFVANLQTDVSSKKTQDSGTMAFVPIEIPIKGSVLPDRLAWTDGYHARIEELKTELEDTEKRLSDSQRQEAAIQKKLFNMAGGTPTDQREQLSDQHTKLRTQSETLKRRVEEIKDILEKLPAAHARILSNKQLRVDFSVSLVPAMDGERAASLPEEALLLLRSDPTLQSPPKEAVPQ